jgi:hypothetical protein
MRTHSENQLQKTRKAEASMTIVITLYILLRTCESRSGRRNKILPTQHCQVYYATRSHIVSLLWWLLCGWLFFYYHVRRFTDLAAVSPATARMETMARLIDRAAHPVSDISVLAIMALYPSMRAASDALPQSLASA